MTHKTTFAVVFVLLLSAVVFAQVPRIMNYQGKLTNSDGVAINDTCTIIFRLYDAATGGNLLWCDTMTVDVVNGLFEVQLDLSHNGGDTLKFDRPYWIALKVRDDPEMTPREKLAPVSFAFRSIYADTADYASSSLNKQDFRLGPEGTSSRIRGLVSSCSELPSSGNLTWTLITNHTGVPYDFCISSEFSPGGSYGETWYGAEASCEDLGGRLCTQLELMSFYYQTSTPVNGYWTAGLQPIGNDAWHAFYCNSTNCLSVTDVHLGYGAYYRCCVPVK